MLKWIGLYYRINIQKKHVSDAVIHRLNWLMTWTVDTDAAVIAVSLFRDMGADELWLVFGSGKSLRYNLSVTFQVHVYLKGNFVVDMDGVWRCDLMI